MMEVIHREHVVSDIFVTYLLTRHFSRDGGHNSGRVNFFMNKLRTLGFSRYDGEIEAHSLLLNVVLNH
jgi:hypothetical protein